MPGEKADDKQFCRYIEKEELFRTPGDRKRKVKY